MKEDLSRIGNVSLIEKIMQANRAASFIENGMVVASSGFTKSGDSKAVLLAFAERAEFDPIKITLITGASLGQHTDARLGTAGAVSLRLPFQADPVMRTLINEGQLMYIDENLGETAMHLKTGIFGEIDIAVLEASSIKEDGSIIPTTSVGNSAVFAALAKQIIVEINVSVPADIEGIHDILLTGKYPDKAIIPIISAGQRVGRDSIPCDPEKIIGIVFTDKKDSPADILAPDKTTQKIASYILDFLKNEVRAGRLTNALLPLQAGIGKVANAVLQGFAESDFGHLTIYSEVLQDSTFDLFDAGKLDFASGSSITVSQSCYERIFDNWGSYKDKILLRPQDITNSAEVISRLGVIAINTALECDIYGNVNSSHISGTDIMNGIGGSADFAQNSYLSIFVTESTCKGNTISRVVPMVSHVDHSEHDVDILVTEQGLADLRGLAPRQKAKTILQNCVHPEYRGMLEEYFKEACQRGGQTPHVIEKAFDCYKNLRLNGSMKRHHSLHESSLDQS
ncbi:succinate CoA transferase [Dyadobacter pollutisoli]|uniref:Succinate CoA transferase n=1 Tax=Dyadobacter pollutisoli TaxID=2910158 RepID=A0A9E8NEF8_9BACT|nr:succinate CoA transferase [Dyadobacter pollutisoli]WAC13476.1 succinate CoA transferase [Dyadobacter pollutisoli]